VAYGALGRTDIAAQFFQEAFKLDPTAPDTAYNIARMKFAQGDFAQAQQFAESAMTLARQCGIASRAAEICRRVADAAPQIDRLASEELSRVASTVATEPSVQRSGLDKWDLKLAARNRDVIPISRLLKKSASLHKALPPRPLSSLALAQPPAITTKPTKPVLDKPLPKGPIASAQPEKVMLTAMPMTALEKPEMIQPGVRLRIVNGVGTRHMARRMALYLRTEGHSVNALANAKPYRQEKSVIRYRAGFRDAALALAQRLPSGVELIEDHIARADIQLTLGKDLLGFDRSLRTA
jgi:tetratricopeptide (TPR) repeat protein